MFDALKYVKTLHAGGDWGGFICRALGTLHAKHVAAIHVNLAFATPSYTSPWHMLQARRPALPLRAVSLAQLLACENADCTMRCMLCEPLHKGCAKAYQVGGRSGRGNAGAFMF